MGVPDWVQVKKKYTIHRSPDLILRLLIDVTLLDTVALPKAEGQLCIYQQGKPF